MGTGKGRVMGGGRVGGWEIDWCCLGLLVLGGLAEGARTGGGGWGGVGDWGWESAGLVHDGVAVAAVGEEKVLANGEALLCALAVRCRLDKDDCGEEVLDVPLIAMLVDQQSQE